MCVNNWKVLRRMSGKFWEVNKCVPISDKFWKFFEMTGKFWEFNIFVSISEKFWENKYESSENRG